MENKYPLQKKNAPTTSTLETRAWPSWGSTVQNATSRWEAAVKEMTDFQE